jgi:hypothetical protein
MYKARNKTTENIRLPYFAKAFYLYIDENNKIPNQKTIWDYYLERNSNNRNLNRLTEKELKALKARMVTRAYPSLLRDLHLGKKLSEMTDLKVIFNVSLDIMGGIDLLIYYNNYYYCIHNFFSTRRSKKFRKKKKYRHKTIKENNYCVIDLPYIQGTGLLVGKNENKFELYDEKHIIQIQNIILKNSLESVG